MASRYDNRPVPVCMNQVVRAYRHAEDGYRTVDLENVDERMTGADGAR